MFTLYRSIPIGRRSNIIDIWGEIPHTPKRDLVFVDQETGVTFTTNDLFLKKLNRNKKLSKLYHTYKNHIEDKRVSTVLYVVKSKQLSNLSNHIKNLKRKCLKKGIGTYAYYWQRDIGEIEFSPHYHLILILSPLDISIFKTLFKKKNRCGYVAELCHSLYLFTKYLDKKEFYAPFRKRNYGISKKLTIPNIIDTV
jgi:hypothetical protein